MGEKHTHLNELKSVRSLHRKNKLLYLDMLEQMHENKAVSEKYAYEGPESLAWLWRYYLAFFGDVRKFRRDVSGQYVATLTLDRRPCSWREVPQWLAQTSRHFYFWVGLVYLVLVGICVSGVICGWVPLLNPWTIVGIVILSGISYIYSRGLDKGILMRKLEQD